jgi:hypothetical protein
MELIYHAGATETQQADNFTFIAYSPDAQRSQSKIIPIDKAGACQRNALRFHIPPSAKAIPPSESNRPTL